MESRQNNNNYGDFKISDTLWLYKLVSGSLFLLVACSGICGLHQHDRPTSPGKLDEGSNRRNQKTMGHSNGIGNGVSGPVRGIWFKFNVFLQV